MDPYPNTDTLKRRRRRRKSARSPSVQNRDGSRKLAWSIGVPLCAISLFAAFLVGRNTGPETAPTGVPSDAIVPLSAAPKAITEGIDSPARMKALDAFDRGISLVAERKPEDAEREFRQALATDPTFPGVHYQLAEIARRRGDTISALREIDLSIGRGESLADCYLLKGSMLELRQQTWDAAGRAYASAVQADPANPEPYLLWGELLRKDGHVDDAVKRLEQAAVRATKRADGFAIRLKLALARVEKGEPDPELDSKLSGKDAAPESLVEGAALALRHDDWETAKSLLNRARAAMNREFYEWVLQDQFFDLYRVRPEMGGMLDDTGERDAELPTG